MEADRWVRPADIPAGREAVPEEESAAASEAVPVEDGKADRHVPVAVEAAL